MIRDRAGILSVVATFAMITGFIFLLEKLGFTFFIDYGETIYIDHGIWDEEKDGGISNVGWYILIISTILGWRLFHWLVSGKIFGDLKYPQRLAWRYWFIGLTITTVMIEIVYMFDLHYWISRLVSLTIYIVMAGVLFINYSNKASEYYRIERIKQEILGNAESPLTDAQMDRAIKIAYIKKHGHKKKRKYWRFT